MQVHLEVERLVQELGQPLHGRQRGRLGRRHGEEPTEVNQVDVILRQVVAVALQGERPVPDPLHEGVGVVRLPDRVRRLTECIAPPHGILLSGARSALCGLPHRVRPKMSTGPLWIPGPDN